MDAILERAAELKQKLLRFVLEAEGDLATALETYMAEEGRSSQTQDATQRNLLLDTFLVEGRIHDHSPLELFLGAEPELTEPDRHVLNIWRRSFLGLFAIIQVLADGFKVMNWLTAKQYLVKPNSLQTLQEMSRFREGEVLLTRIAPVTDAYWMFSGPCIPMGRLGKPKLAVAIGNFKQNHKKYLYSDAPELLKQAWQSVEKYHLDFVNFFGGSEVTLSGHALSQKMEQFQESIAQQQLATAGVDGQKSLAEVAAESGVEESEMQAIATALGLDEKAVMRMFHGKTAGRMATPKIEFPAELKKAEQLTVLAHPQWGQLFLPTYRRFQSLLEAEDWRTEKGAENLVKSYLENPAIPPFVWEQLAEKYPTQLEAVLQEVLQRPSLSLKQDLPGLLQEFGKPLEPELPEIASVPLHLHHLFQEALAEVSKTKSKSKDKGKTNKGFGSAKPG